jgi:3-oxoacyl-[acyl-carrier protein] reductase
MADAPLAGKAAIVTGAARNIGRAIALRLAADGCAVLVCANTDAGGAAETVSLIERAGGRAVAHIADITDEDAVAALTQAAAEAFGRIDMLVNNAAIRDHRPLTDMTLADWRRVTAVILDGAFLCARACAPHMIAAGGGAIVNIGGLAGHLGDADRAHVVAAKAGLVGLTRALAAELGQHGITANCVVPGSIRTDRGASASTPGRHVERTSALVARPGVPDDIAATVAHLCRPEGGYITGQTIHVNGGRFLT